MCVHVSMDIRILSAGHVHIECRMSAGHVLDECWTCAGQDPGVTAQSFPTSLWRAVCSFVSKFSGTALKERL